MRKRFRNPVANLRQEFSECWPLLEIRSQRHGVHEVPRDVRKFRSGSARNRAANDNLFLRGEAMEQNLERRQKCREERGLLLLSQPLQCLGQPGVETKRE